VIIFAILAAAYAAVALVVEVKQRQLIFFPSHDQSASPLIPWRLGGQTIGYCRDVPQARTVWLMAHGNAGQASHRGYVLSHLAAADALYVLEYPGYGQRAGQPTRDSMNAAALEAYQALRAAFPRTPVGIIGESIGTGPACFLASAAPPPDKIVLVVPFDVFADVAAEHMPLLPARLMVKDAWDNVAALRNYAGPVDIYGALGDQVIPVGHARRLAASVPQAHLVLIEGGHNDWSESSLVRIER
jgi:uncharacterized protein